MEPEDYLEIAKFLPNLPKANLDDRSFEDLVEECLLRIPRYCPEWTNYNPGDPGVTLIELFAWLVHQMLYRFNYVPRRHYVAFLEMLGVRLQPPKPAQVELTFYLTKAQDRPTLITEGTEVATVRTENQEAVVFTTDRNLIVGLPRIHHILLGRDSEPDNFPEELDNPFTGTIYQQERQWDALDRTVSLFSPCTPGNAFYLVLAPENISEMATADGGNISQSAPGNALEGNILALTFKGPRAVTTGIDPNNPPLRWEAWNGHRWVSEGILRIPTDDRTKGFSFDRLGESGPNPEQEGADVILHLPQSWAQADFNNEEYQGYWIRCVYAFSAQGGQQFGYQRSPEITGVSVRTIGGTIGASECVVMQEEVLGESDGKPGQIFPLSSKPVLRRSPEEHIQLRLPDGTTENWIEQPDFGDSRENSPHYVLDSMNGTVQFGPLVRESFQLQRQTFERSRTQSWGRPFRTHWNEGVATPYSGIPALLHADDQTPERQYGRVPPLGAEIIMTRYRTGGGSRGNVQARQLTVLKTALPYVKSVINYRSAVGGDDAESLDDAVMRVPALLRTRQTALTPEEFQEAACRFRALGLPRVHRAHCITSPYLTTAGVIHLLVIPSAPLPFEDFNRGLNPNDLMFTPEFHQKLLEHLNVHKALGLRVKLEEPEYVGVQVTAEVFLQPQFCPGTAQSEFAKQVNQLALPVFESHSWGARGKWLAFRATRQNL
jgi:predicted phage baseplate assembly protein